MSRREAAGTGGAGPCACWTEGLQNRAVNKTDTERPEVLNKFFTACQACHISQVPKPPGRGLGSRALPTVSEEQIRDLLTKPNRYMSVGPGDMNPTVLRGLGCFCL